jgi:hypothetical protein
MLNGFFALVFAFTIVGACYFIPRALRLDAADEYHLLHGPASDCVECGVQP